MTTHPQPVGTVVPDDKGPNQTDNSSGQRRERTMRTIRVTRKGQIKVKPDMTRITMTLEGLFKDYGETLRHSSEDTEELKDVLSTFGFERADLKTLNFSVDTEYESYKDRDGTYKQRFSGYRFRHMLKVEFPSDNDRLGKVLYTLANCKVRPEFRISYTVSDPEAAKNTLLGKAVADAKEKASVLTQAAGVALKDIQTIDYSWGEIDFEYRPMNGDVLMECCATPMAAKSYDLDIEPDDINVSDTVPAKSKNLSISIIRTLKRSIIEYLADLSQNIGIDLLMLTHNFDFYRTVMSRLGLRRDHCYIAQKDDAGKITMKVFRYQKDFFKNVIIAGINGADDYNQKKMLIASIPFYRNLAEYCGDNAEYLQLTCYLHYKSNPVDTASVTLSDLWAVISQYVNGATASFGAENFYNTLQLLATDVSIDYDDISLENKLIVSIASRLRAEKYLKQVIISHEGSCTDSESNQMREWYERAKPYLSDEEKRLMDDINLITPESIHLNAFMYEPLIDVSIWTLNDIYGRTIGLGVTP